MGEDSNWDLVLVIELELCCDVANLSDHDASVLHVSNHHGTDRVADVEDVGDTIGNNQLIRHLLLSADHNAIGTADSNRSLTKRLDGLEGVLDLVDAAIWGEDLLTRVLC